MPKIRKSELIENNLLDGLKKDAREAKELTDLLTLSLKALNDTTKSLKKSAESIKGEFLGIDRKKIQDLEKINKLTKEASTAAINQEKVQKQKLQTEKQLELNRQTQIKTQILLRKEKERLAKAAARNVKATKDEGDAYKKLVVETRQVKNESKRLGAEMLKLERSGKKNSKEYRLLGREYDQTSRKARGLDKSLKKIDSTVGDNFRKVGGYTKSLNGLKTTMLSMIGAFGAIQVIRGAGETIAEFDTQVKSLVSITGASGKDLEFFKNQAKTLGVEVAGGAAAVIEAYKLIGSAKPELLENAEALDALTQSAITLSQASGLDLPDAATRLTDAMNQFGAPAEDAAKFIDVLANASLEGSAAIPDVTDALLKFGAVAKTSNVSIDESAALIEVLASKGLKGAEAGTALRNVMLKLSAPDALPKEAQEMMKKLGISFEDISDPSKSFAERLSAMKPLLKDSAALQKVFGKENTVAAINLIELTDETERLTEAMGNQGTAQKQAAENTDTISFAFNKLKETWNSFVLDVNEGSGIGEVVKDLFLFIAENLQTIVSVVTKAAGAWLTYKAILVAIQAKNFLLNGGLKDTVKNMASQTKGFFKMGKAAEAGADGIKKTGRAMNAIPWVALIGAAIELATSFYDIASGAKSAREQTEALNRGREQGAQVAERLTKAIRKNIEAGEELIQTRLAEEKIDAAGATKERIALFEKELKTVDQLIDANKKGQRTNQVTIDLAQARIDVLQAEIRTGATNATELAEQALKIDQQRLDAVTRLQQLNTANNELGGTREEMRKTLRSLGIEEKKNNTETKSAGINATINAKAEKKRNTEFKNQIDLLKELNDLMEERREIQKEFEDIDREQEITDLNQIIEAQKELQLLSVSQAKKEEDVTTDIEPIKEFVEERKNLEISGIEATRDFEIAALKRGTKAKFKQKRDDLDAEHAVLIAQAKLTDAEKIIIEQNFQAELKKIQKQETDEIKRDEAEIINLKKQANSDIIDVERASAQEVDDIQEEFSDAEKQRIEELKAAEIDANKDIVDSDAESIAKRKALIDALTQFAIKKSDERIKKLDEEINAHKKQADFLRGLAASGNITAKESLAEENRLIAEANDQKAKEEKRKQRIILASTVLSSYNQKLGQGKSGTEALLEAISEVGTLSAFLNALPTFKEGITNTGKHGKGIDGQGGFLSVLHEGERVVPEEDNKKIPSGMSNKSLAQIAGNQAISNQTEAGVQLHMGFDSQRVVEELMNVQGEMKGVKQAINDKEVPSYAVGETFQKSFEIIETMKSKHGKTQNTFIVKPN